MILIGDIIINFIHKGEIVMGRIFGTDGARGIAVTELTCEMAMQIGRAAALVLTKATNHKPQILIGKDTRISSDILESALVAGICSVGADAHILGVVPTPAVATLIKKYNADAGVMISASHNSVEFNGIKLFSNTGFKLSDEIEAEIEELILDKPHEIRLVSGTELGHIIYEKDASWDYVRYLMKTIDTRVRYGIDDVGTIGIGYSLNSQPFGIWYLRGTQLIAITTGQYSVIFIELAVTTGYVKHFITGHFVQPIIKGQAYLLTRKVTVVVLSHFFGGQCVFP